jgi:hypothetical protein
MLTFKSFECLSQLDSDHPSRAVVEDLLNTIITEAEKHGHIYNPDHDGHIVLPSRETIDIELDLFTPPRKLEDVFWEGVDVRSDHFIAVFLPNNQFGLIFVIPDEDWLPNGLRRVLCENLVPTVT